MNIIADIITGRYDDQIDAIAEAARSRRNALRTAQAHTLKEGDVVVLSGLSPKYINGKKATVVAVKRTRVTVSPVEPVGKFRGLCDVPLTCITLAQ